MFAPAQRPLFFNWFSNQLLHPDTKFFAPAQIRCFFAAAQTPRFAHRLRYRDIQFYTFSFRIHFRNQILHSLRHSSTQLVSYSFLHPEFRNRSYTQFFAPIQSPNYWHQLRYPISAPRVSHSYNQSFTAAEVLNFWQSLRYQIFRTCSVSQILASAMILSFVHPLRYPDFCTHLGIQFSRSVFESIFATRFSHPLSHPCLHPLRYPYVSIGF
jgi:hypothetical protein